MKVSFLGVFCESVTFGSQLWFICLLFLKKKMDTFVIMRGLVADAVATRMVGGEKDFVKDEDVRENLLLVGDLQVWGTAQGSEGCGVEKCVGGLVGGSE